MTPFEFLDLFNEHLYAAVAFCAASLCLYLIIFKGRFTSVADPIFVGLVASAFSSAVVVILVYVDKIDNQFLYSFLATEAAFIGAALWHRSGWQGIQRLKPVKNDIYTYLIFHYLIVLSFFIASLLYLVKVGLPIFQSTSRLITFDQLGLLTWFLDVTWVGTPLSVLLKRFYLNRKHYFDNFIVVLAVFLFATKGGKSDLIYIVFLFHLYSQVTGDNAFRKTEKILLFLFPLLLVLITSMILSAWNVDSSALQLVLERFILFGDAFFMGYNNSFLLSIPNVDFFDVFFGGTKAGLYQLFFDANYNRFIFGNQITDFYYGFGEGYGPNARHNIIGLIIFGPVMSVLFSGVCGYLFGLSRVYAGGSKHSIISIFIYIMINIYSWFFFIDPTLALGFVLKLVFVISPLFLLSHIINHGLVKYFRPRITT